MPKARVSAVCVSGHLLWSKKPPLGGWGGHFCYLFWRVQATRIDITRVACSRVRSRSASDGPGRNTPCTAVLFRPGVLVLACTATVTPAAHPPLRQPKGGSSAKRRPIVKGAKRQIEPRCPTARCVGRRTVLFASSRAVVVFAGSASAALAVGVLVAARAMRLPCLVS